MFLTKIELDIGSRAVREALADCQKMHRLLNGLCDESRMHAQLLYRVKTEGRKCAVYLYSAEALQPERCLPFMHWAGDRDISAFVAGLQNGRTLRFDLLTMPSKKVGQEGKKNSQRRVLRTVEERLAWIQRKAEQNGFAIQSLQEQKSGGFLGNHDEIHGSRMYWNAYHYTGVLEITDETAFRKAFSEGIGPGKAYGLGMILVF